MGGYWRRHPDKALQSVLGELHAAGWRIESTKKYCTLYCPCEQQTPVSGEFHVHGARDLDAETDALMDALLELEEASGGVISDVDVTAALAASTVTVTLTVDAASLDEAEQIGVRIINQAIAASGGQTTQPASMSPGSGSGYEAHRRASELVPA